MVNDETDLYMLL